MKCRVNHRCYLHKTTALRSLHKFHGGQNSSQYLGEQRLQSEHWLDTNWVEGIVAAALRRHGVKEGQWDLSNCGWEPGNMFTTQQDSFTKTALLLSWGGWGVRCTHLQSTHVTNLHPVGDYKMVWHCATVNLTAKYHSIDPQSNQYVSALSSVFLLYCFSLHYPRR